MTIATKFKKIECQSQNCEINFIPTYTRDKFHSFGCQIDSLIDKDSHPHQCHIWDGKITDFGKPKITKHNINGRSKAILVQTWIFFDGNIPNNEPIVRTICGSEGCLNRDHMTHEKNNIG